MKREDGKPFCWQQGPSGAPMGDLPKGIRAKVQELRHGFSTLLHSEVAGHVNVTV